MIGIGFDHLFVIHNLIFIFLLIVFWTRQIFREKVYEWNISQEFLCRCNHCSLTFMAHRSESVVRCPGCHEMHKIKTKKSSKRIRY